MIRMAKTVYTAATLAAEVETAPKELRKFLRTEESGVAPVGKGGRYAIEMTATQLAKFKKNFTAWTEANEVARAERKAALEAAQVATEVAEDDISDAEAKKINVLTIGDRGEIMEDDEDSTDFDTMTDEDIEAALDELATEGLDEA
jgi:hypothetical protein